MVKVFVVILNWNRADDTIDCLKSVAKLKTKDINLTSVVVDNNSTDDSLARIKKYTSGRKGVVILRNKSNLGFTGGNNTGVKYALKSGTDYVLVLNNDTILDKSLLEELIRVAELNPDAAAFSPKIYFAPGFEFHKDRYDKRVLGRVIWSAGGKIDWKNVYGSSRGVDEVDRGKYDKVGEIDYAVGTCALYRSETLNKVGIFDPGYFLYYDDTDLSLRIKRSGGKIFFVPDAVIWHKVSQSSGIGSDLNDYYITRNRMLFGMKYAPIRAKFALLRESLKFLFIGRKWQRIGIVDFYSGNFGKGSWK